MVRGTSAAEFTMRPGLSLSRQVSDDLLARIGRGEFGPGDKLPGETELMAYYGVGRNAVREAVQGLVALEMVDVRPRRGAIVLAASPQRALPHHTLTALLSRELTEDLYEMRLLLETEAAARAAARHDPTELAEIRRRHEVMRAEVESGVAPWLSDLKFHYAIANACGNSVLPIMLEAASALLARDRQAAAALVEEAHEAFRQHDEILLAIEAGDPMAARLRMAEHIRTASTYVARLRERAGNQTPTTDEGVRDATARR